MSTNLPQVELTNSVNDVKTFFDKYFKQQIVFPAAQIDAVVGFFEKRGFSLVSANSISIVLLTQSRVENISIFQIIDTLKGLSDVQLSQVVTEILNTSREKTSVLGYKIINTDETTESRNIKI